MNITATVEKGTIRLPEHLQVPDGTQVEINLPVEPTSAAAGEWMLEYAGIADDLPPDAAAQHDHYLYGTPRR